MKLFSVEDQSSSQAAHDPAVVSESEVVLEATPFEPESLACSEPAEEPSITMVEVPDSLDSPEPIVASSLDLAIVGLEAEAEEDDKLVTPTNGSIALPSAASPEPVQVEVPLILEVPVEPIPLVVLQEAVADLEETALEQGFAEIDSVTPEAQEASTPTTAKATKSFNVPLSIKINGLPTEVNLISGDSPISIHVPYSTLDPDATVQDVVNEYFDEEDVSDEPTQNGNILSSPDEQHRPASPLARLAYDIPESPSVYKTFDSASSPPPSPSPSRHDLLTSQTVLISSRPPSMVELSPSHVELAHRISPSVSRGVPMFIPPPPRVEEIEEPSQLSPTLEETDDDSATEEASSPAHHYNQSLLTPDDYAEPDLSTDRTKSGTFSTVVHNKRQVLSSASAPAIMRPISVAKAKRAIVVEVPESPGYGELAMLLEEAALLETRLENGEIPSEEFVKAKARAEAEAIARAKAEEEERERAAAAALVKPAPPKEEAPPSKPKHTFRNPLGKSKTTQRNRTSILGVDAAPRAKSAFLPDFQPMVQEPLPADTTEHPRRLHSMSETGHESSSTLRADAGEVPPTPPPKSPRARYFSGFRRTSRSSSTMPGAYPRHSMSTASELSSEDSMAVITPPDHSLDFAGSGSMNGSNTGLHWPSLSPRKSAGSLSRATSSFAEKLWRGRTKSSASMMSTSDAPGMFLPFIYQCNL